MISKRVRGPHPNRRFSPPGNQCQVIAMGKRDDISPLRVRERVTYDPATGEFVWLPKPGNDRQRSAAE